MGKMKDQEAIINSLQSELSNLEELKAKVSKHQAFEEHLHKENCKLKEMLKSVKNSPEMEEEWKRMKQELEIQVVKLKEELGEKNIALASLKVDVERGELHFKKKAESLQADLEYERTHIARLTQQLRRQQSSAMETTCFGAPAQASSTSSAASSVSTNTSVNTTSNESPVWSSGSGALKEMRLHDAEVKVKSLEKENVRLKEHEEFYINKAREWKSRALKYERTLQENGVPVPQPRDKRQHQEKSEVNKENTNSDSQLQSNKSNSVNKKDTSACQQDQTEEFDLVLKPRQEPKRTAEDFRLPEGSRKRGGDDCKTQ